MKNESIKRIVKEGYAKIAKRKSPCCIPSDSCYESSGLADCISKKIGYSQEELEAIPEGANLGLGCGHPVALSSLREGETVLDLGCGAGLDCFLAAQRVGKSGRVIGVDMTPEMIEKAREHAEKGRFGNVEFKLAEIEDLPLADDSVDIVISNCVINLSPDKKRVFREAFRVLKPGGRLMISDIVLLKELPDSIKKSVEAYIGCVAGAILKDEYLSAIKEAGFQKVKIMDETSFPVDFLDKDPITQVTIENLKTSPEMVKEVVSSVVSIKVSGSKSKNSS